MSKVYFKGQNQGYKPGRILVNSYIVKSPYQLAIAGSESEVHLAKNYLLFLYYDFIIPDRHIWPR